MMNRFFTLLFAASCLTAVGQVPDYVPADGLVAWYPLDGNTLDYSNQNLHGTGNNINEENFGPNRFGNNGVALILLEQGEYISCPNWFASSPMQTEWTMAIWIRRTSTDSYPPQLIFGHRAHFRDKLIQFRSGTTVDANTRISTGTNLAVNWTLSDNDTLWHHLALVSSESDLALYVDGILIGEVGREGHTDRWDQSVYGDFIGGNGYDPSWSGTFIGELDEAGIWNRPLLSEEVASLFLGTPPVSGCTDPNACNFSIEASVDDGSCQSPGCMDENACNFDSMAVCSSNDCDFTCCPGPGCCHAGTVWDVALQQCVVAEPAYLNEPGEAAVLNPCYFDSDDDGLVDVNDLMNLLTVYNLACGDASETTAFWQCGDPLEYQGYDYETVQIGDQCWFAENLRAENYRNGDEILSDLDDETWSATISGATTVYGEGASNCAHYSPDGDACDESWSLDEYGRLYNWYSVDDVRGLCPVGWLVPSDGEWAALLESLGGESIAANEMKTSFGWRLGLNGSNSSGFSGLPGGIRATAGNFFDAGYSADWWSASPNGSQAWSWILVYNNDILHNSNDPKGGFSVRCIKDAE